MKFVISYSGGKDSVMALHKMLAAGHMPIGLLVTVNREMRRSWFHGVDFDFLKTISDSLGIPLILCESGVDDYNAAIEKSLAEAKERGAEACVFGDIDIEDHLQWCKERCAAVDIGCIHPLWQRDRKENTEEIISLGYQCLIKCVSNQALPQSFLGRILDTDLVEEMTALGIDVCGENGEYHTVVVDGPVFRYPVGYECKEILDFGSISAVNICAKYSAAALSCISPEEFWKEKCFAKNE